MTSTSKHTRKRYIRHMSDLKNDGFVNAVTGLGDVAFDNRESATLLRRSMNHETLSTYYSSSWLAQKIVDTIPDEMTREWGCVKVAGESDAEEALESALRDLNIKTVLNKAFKLSRLHGGAVILLGVDDGQVDLSQPLIPEQVRSLDYLTVFEVGECKAMRWEANPLSRNYGECVSYGIYPRVLGGGAAPMLSDVHHSRLLVLKNHQVTKQQLLVNNGYGESVLQPMYELVRDYGLTWQSVPVLLEKFAMPLMKFKGLKDALAAGREDYLRTRMQTIQLSWNTLRAAVIDSEETIELMSASLAGMPEVLDRLGSQVAAAARMPLTLLFGDSPAASLAAAGSGEARQWYDQVKAAQEAELLPHVRRILEILMLSSDGPTGGKLPENWSFEFKPLWQPTEKEKAETRKVVADTDNVYLAAGVVTTDEIRESRFAGDDYSMQTNLDDDASELDVMDKGSEEDRKNARTVESPDAQPSEGQGQIQASTESLNGAQVTSALQIVQAVAKNELPRDSGVQMLQAFFGLKPELSEAIMGSVGKGFSITPAPAPNVTVGTPNVATKTEATIAEEKT